jgi:hypothetical protein
VNTSLTRRQFLAATELAACPLHAAPPARQHEVERRADILPSREVEQEVLDILDGK